MTDEDRTRWNKRFEDGAYSERTHPSALLEQYQSLFTPMLHAGEQARALDIACGAGRNTHYLCELGFNVTAVDVSDVALRRLLANSSASHAVGVIEHDLDEGLPKLAAEYSTIIIMRFLKLELMPELQLLLAPGGVLMCEVLLQQPLNSASASHSVGPSAGRFRARAGALARSVAGLEVLHSYEGDIIDPDGKTAHVAQLIAKRSI